MTDPQTIDQLDERGRRAGRELLQRADTRPRPTFDPDLAGIVPSAGRPPRHLDRRPLLAAASVAAVVAALVGAAVWTGTRDEGDRAPAAQVTSDSIRPYLPAVLPAGLELAGVAEQGVPGSSTAEPGLGALHTFGPVSDDPRLGVLVMADALDDDAPTIAVGDRTGRLHDLGDAGFGPILEVPTSPDTGPYLWFLGPGLGRDELVGIAAATTLDGYLPVIADDALPDGWERQGAVAAGMEAISPIAGMRAGANDHVLVAQHEGSESGRALMVSVSSQVALVDAQRLFLTDTTEVEVRGHRAVVGRWNLGGNADEMWVARWVERPGEALTVNGIGLSLDEVLAAAESLEPVEPTRWAELVEATALGDLGRGPIEGAGTELGRGEFADGTAWVLRLTAPGSGADSGLDGTLELDVALAGDSSSTSGSMSSVGTAIDEDGNPVELPDRVFGTMTTLEKGGRAFVSGLVRSDVTRVELYDERGAPLAAPVTVVTADGHTAWVAELDGRATTVAAFGDAGPALARASVPTITGGRVDWDASGPTTTAGG
jgi:hypothetical protein